MVYRGEKEKNLEKVKIFFSCGHRALVLGGNELWSLLLIMTKEIANINSWRGTEEVEISLLILEINHSCIKTIFPYFKPHFLRITHHGCGLCDRVNVAARCDQSVLQQNCMNHLFLEEQMAGLISRFESSVSQRTDGRTNFTFHTPCRN